MIEAGGRKPSFFVYYGESETEDGLWRRQFDDLKNSDNSGNNDNDGNGNDCENDICSAALYFQTRTISVEPVFTTPSPYRTEK